MSILKSTHSGKDTPLTENYLLNRGYKPYRKPNWDIFVCWEPPKEIAEKSHGMSAWKPIMSLKDDDKFICEILYKRPATLICTIEALDCLEKYWTSDTGIYALKAEERIFEIEHEHIKKH